MAQVEVLRRHAGGVSVDASAESPAMNRCDVSRCEVIRNVQGLRAIAADWRSLQRAAGQDTLAFQSVEWALAWSETFMSGDDATLQRQPLVVLQRDAAGKPVLLMPLMREHYPFGLSVITWLSDPFGQYGDAITTLKGEALHEALDTVMAVLHDEGADLIRLRNVRADAAIRPWLERNFSTTPEQMSAPWLDLTPFATPEDFDARFNAKQRRRRRKIYSTITQLVGAEPVFRRIEGVQAQQRAISELLQAKRAWLKEKGLVSRALFCDRTESFLHHLAETSSAGEGACELVITTMEADGRQISWELGLRFRGRHYAYITAHRLELTRFSISRLHMFFAQRLAVQEGLRAFDMLVPAAPHKMSWSSDEMPVHNYYRAFTARGRLLGQGYLNFMRPLMRKAYHVIPPHIRRMLRLSELAEHESGMN